MTRFSAVCCDSNIVVRLITQTRNDVFTGLWEQWLLENRTIVAPSLLRYEVTNALHRSQRLELVPPNEAIVHLRAALDLPIHYLEDDDLHLAAVDFAQRFDLPAAYDAHYLAAAIRNDCELWTCDRRLYNTVSHQLHWVHFVE